MRTGDESINKALMEPANKRYHAAACEATRLSSLQIESDEDLGARVTLFFGPAYDRMTKCEHINAMYWHACLMFANGMSMNNQSLRERFGLDSERKNMLAMPPYPQMLRYRFN